VIGLQRGTVRLVPYTKEWEILFKTEKLLLKWILNGLVLDIQHVGSTAIPDMPSKPIIDIVVGVKTVNDFGECTKPLQSAGYLFRENASNWREFFFAKGPEEKRTCHLHLMKYNGEIWKDYLAFRDYLITNKKCARQYASLKEKLSKRFADNRAKYTASKSKFIRETIKIARKYPQKHNNC
jgi:GrpB-like predicted nucleotidyltransferase (UPF0157 family)